MNSSFDSTKCNFCQECLSSKKCRECNQNFCDECANLHIIKLKNFPNHRLEDIVDTKIAVNDKEIKSEENIDISLKAYQDCPKCKSKLDSEVYMLSCMHNFCGTCIASMRVKTTTTCVLCSTATNNNDVVRNNFIEKMASIQKIIDGSKNKDIYCNSCSPAVVSAVKHCADCSQFVCLKCSASHTLLNHNVADKKDINKMSFNSQNLKCKKHNTENLTMYCRNCDALICSSCSAVDHSNHEKDDDLNKIFTQSKLEILEKIAEIEKLVESQRRHKIENEKIEAELNFKVNVIRADIEARAGQLIKSIQDIRSNVLDKLEAYKKKYNKIIDDKSNQIDDYIAALNYQRSNFLNIADNGSNFDIFDLKNVTNENNWMNDKMPNLLTNISLSYEKSKIDDKLFECSNLFGFLKDMKKFVLRKENFPGRFFRRDDLNRPSSLVIENYLYVSIINSKYIDIYDIDSLMYKSSISCDNYFNQSLVLSKSKHLFTTHRNIENFKTVIYIYNFKTKNFDEWKTLNRCNISSTNRCTILVTTDDRKVIEYSVEGHIINEFKIPDNANLPQKYFLYMLKRNKYFTSTHQLNNGRYVVSYFDYQSALISLLDDKGMYINSFTKDTATDIMLCTDGEIYIFVLECNIGMISVLSAEIKKINEFQIPGAVSISFDQENDKLLVATTEEILYFNYLLKNF